MSLFPINDTTLVIQITEPTITAPFKPDRLKESVTQNFIVGEYVKATKMTRQEKKDFVAVHIHENIPLINQTVRDHFGKPVYLGSLGRTLAWEIAQGRDGSSSHVDLVATDLNGGKVGNPRRKEFRDFMWNEYQSKGELYQALRELGVTSWGFYDWGVHLDVRERKSDGDDRFWDDRKKKSVSLWLWVLFLPVLLWLLFRWLIKGRS